MTSLSDLSIYLEDMNSYTSLMINSVISHAAHHGYDKRSSQIEIISGTSLSMTFLASTLNLHLSSQNLATCTFNSNLIPTSAMSLKSSSSLAPELKAPLPPAKRRKVSTTKKPKVKGSPIDRIDVKDEFQQVTLHPFVDQYKIKGMGYGGDVYYQSDVCFSKF